MQFSSAVLFTAFVSTVFAASVPNAKRFDIPGFKCDGFDALKCVASLSPAVVSCIAAAVQAGVDPIADAGCAVSAGNDIINFPATCQECF